jgi:Tol biopolymer transport system component
VRLVKGVTEDEFAGSWSPDGRWFTYLAVKGDKFSLNKVKTTGEATPEILKADTTDNFTQNWVPIWSPTGDWILYADTGATLISPDGKTTRNLRSTPAAGYAFSADGKIVYGIRPAASGGTELFSMSVDGGREKVLGELDPDQTPSALLQPSLRLSLSPDGRSLAYSTQRRSSTRWLVEGLDAVASRLSGR